jgi:AraC-like DNA-binding protein
MSDASEHYFITSNYSRIIARELQLQEKDLTRLLSGTGLSRNVLLPGDDTRLSWPQQQRIIQNAKIFNNLPDLGLRIGRHLQPSAHGPIGYLALSSPDLITALRALRDYLPLRIAFAQLELDQSAQWLTCTLRIKAEATADDERLLLECFALLLQALVESILGTALSDARFSFEFAAPAYTRVYADYFHSAVRFSQPDNQLQLPAELALTPNASGDPHSYTLARELCQKLLNEAPGVAQSTTDRVRHLILSKPAGSVNEEDIASALFISKRTLARRLQREGSAYRDIREQLFAELAARHLRDTELTVEAIALLLGYHDAANFRRAFRRWYQLSPHEFRRSTRGAARA